MNNTEYFFINKVSELGNTVVSASEFDVKTSELFNEILITHYTSDTKKHTIFLYKII